MERSEPALVPEWLRTSGSVTTNQPASSSSSSDDHPVSNSTRNKLSVSISSHDSGRSFASLDRTTSSYFRRASTSNGSAHSRSYSTFSKSHREKDWEKDINEIHSKDKHRDYIDHLGNILPNRYGKDILRRSNSMVSGGRRGENWPKKVASDSNNVNKSNHTNGNGLGGMHKVAFEREFPSLGGEEIGRVASPGLSSAIHSLPTGSSTVIGGDGWTSALVEVPTIIGSSGSSPVGANTANTGLNMAEALAQGPTRARTTPQPSVGVQRLEELAIKQSRQLIPMTPSTPKALVLNSSDKSKPKIGQQTQQQQLPSLNPVLRGSPARSDSPKSSTLGKLQILKPTQENGLSPTAKESLSPTNSSRSANSPLAASGSAVLKSPTIKPTSVLSLEKKPATSQAQSRSDFFNLIKKKSSANSSSSFSSAVATEKPDDVATKAATTPVTLQGTDNTAPSVGTISNGNAYDSGLEKLTNNSEQKELNCSSALDPDEEEAAFLRSLGWEENDGDDEGLTEEEIRSFYKDYMKLMPTSKLLQGMQPKISMLLDSRVGSVGGASSGLSSSGK